MQSRILVVFAISTSFLGLPAATDIISKPECAAITIKDDACSSGTFKLHVKNNCSGSIVVDATAEWFEHVFGTPLPGASQGTRGIFGSNRYVDQKEVMVTRRTVPSGDETVSDCSDRGSMRVTVTALGGASAGVEKSSKRTGGIIATNNFRSSIDYEIYSGQNDGCDLTRDQYITSGSLNSGGTLRLDCKMDNDTQRVGYCYRWKDKRESSFGGLVTAFVCPRSDRPDSKKNF